MQQLRPALDLTQYHFRSRRGDITIFGTWYGEDLRPCLAVVPSIMRQNTAPLVITLDTAYQWDIEDGRCSPQQAARLTGAFAYANGLDHLNRLTLMRITSEIHSMLGDLLSMPPKPIEEYVAADIIQTDNETGKQTVKEIIDHV